MRVYAAVGLKITEVGCMCKKLPRSAGFFHGDGCVVGGDSGAVSR